MVTFGGWKEDFMLVVNKTTPKRSGQSELGTERLLFVMPRGKVRRYNVLVSKTTFAQFYILTRFTYDIQRKLVLHY